MEIKNLYYSSSIDNVFIEDLSFQINSGITSIIVPNYSIIKSLAKILCGMENNIQGQVINRKKTAFIPNKSNSFPWLTVEENISFGLKNNIEDEVSNIINLLELDGYEKHISRNDSVGFNILVAIGRAIAHKFENILLIDPFDNLSSLMRERLLRILKKINNKTGITLIIITSNLNNLEISDEIILLGGEPLNQSHEILNSEMEEANLIFKIDSFYKRVSSNSQLKIMVENV